MARSVVFWGCVIDVVAVMAIGLAALAGMDDPLAAAATVFTISFALGIPVVWGGLQGSDRFYALSGAHVLFAASRLAAGLAIALAGGGVGAVMVGVAGATVLTLFISARPIRGLLVAGRGAAGQALATRANVGAALGLTALWALMYSDLSSRGWRSTETRPARTPRRPLPRRCSCSCRSRRRLSSFRALRSPRPGAGAAAPPGGARHRRRGVSREHGARVAAGRADHRSPLWLGVRGRRVVAGPSVPGDGTLRPRDRVPLPLPRARPSPHRGRPRRVAGDAGGDVRPFHAEPGDLDRPCRSPLRRRPCSPVRCGISYADDAARSSNISVTGGSAGASAGRTSKSRCSGFWLREHGRGLDRAAAPPNGPARSRARVGAGGARGLPRAR